MVIAGNCSKRPLIILRQPNFLIKNLSLDADETDSNLRIVDFYLRKRSLEFLNGEFFVD